MKSAAVAAVFGAALAWQAPGASPALVLSRVSIVDASAVPAVRTGSIVVRDGRIVEVGADVAVPAGARLIDGRGQFAVPGLWDMHAHLAALTEVGRAPEQYVGHGVLNVRDMGGLPEVLFPLRARIREGARVGPEIVLAGPTLNSEQPAVFHRRLTTAAEARAAVGELKAAGVDFIKIHRATTRNVFNALADETRRQGLPLAGHVPLAMSWIEASDAGMRSIEHIQTIFENVQPDAALIPAEFESIVERLLGSLGDSIFAALKANGTYFDPTLVGYEASFEKATPGVAARRQAAYSRMKEVAGRAARAGVAIVAGTDVLDRHGEMLLREIERLVEIGLTPREALAAATVTAAAAAGRPELGRIAAGAPASFIVVDADPLADVRHLRRLAVVVLGTRVLDAGDLAALRR